MWVEVSKVTISTSVESSAFECNDVESEENAFDKATDEENEIADVKEEFACEATSC